MPTFFNPESAKPLVILVEGLLNAGLYAALKCLKGYDFQI